MREKITITPLGTRGWIPHEGRQTASTLVQLRGQNFLLDAGSGMSRLLDQKINKQLYDGPLHILLSHYHLDHVIGISWLRGIFEGDNRSIHIYGPSDTLIDIGLKSAMSRLIGAPLFGEELDSFTRRFTLHEMDDKLFEIDGEKIEFFPLRHSGGSVSIKIGGEVSYVTDSSYFSEIVTFVKNSKVLLCESYSLNKDKNNQNHCSFKEALQLAKLSGIESLIPIHFGPDVSEDIISNMAINSNINEAESFIF